MSELKPEADYKSPLRKLVKFFEQSRNKWKEKYLQAKRTVKRLSNRVRYFSVRKEQWKNKANAAEKELKQLRLRSKNQQKELEQLKKKPALVERNKPLEPFEIVPFHHRYSIGQIMLDLSLVLLASNSLRGTSRGLEIILKFFQLESPVPSWYTARFWLLRLGYYKLTTPKEYAGDWIWIVDHTIQLGSEKCLVILGVRICHLPPSGTCLTHDCLEPITLVPLKKSTGEIVFEQLEKSIEKTGIPREIIGDYGSDLKAGIERFCQAHPETDYIHDIKHKTALLLKKELENHEAWMNFTRLAAQTKLEIQQTSLAFLSPPALRVNHVT